MTINYVHKLIIPAAHKLLPAEWDSAEARAMEVTIALQESRLRYRRQVGGPAHGFLQFERGGGWQGVLTHPVTREHATRVLAIMAYGLPDVTDYYALEHNDILAFVFGRLLLRTHPKALPKRNEPGYAWDYYMNLWRPGKPHRHTWDAFYKQAWSLEP